MCWLLLVYQNPLFFVGMDLFVCLFLFQDSRKLWQTAKTKKHYGLLYTMVLGKSSKLTAFEVPCVEIRKISTIHVSFVFFFRSCGVVCEAFYSIKNAQGSGRGRPRKLRGRMSFAEGCGRGCW